MQFQLIEFINSRHTDFAMKILLKGGLYRKNITFFMFMNFPHFSLTPSLPLLHHFPLIHHFSLTPSYSIIRTPLSWDMAWTVTSLSAITETHNLIFYYCSNCSLVVSKFNAIYFLCNRNFVALKRFLTRVRFEPVLCTFLYQATFTAI